MPPAAKDGGVIEQEIKSEKVSVSFPETMLADAKRRAGSKPFSAYLQSLVQRDLLKAPIDGMSDTIMEDLTDRLLGGRHVARLRPIVSSLDQRDELARVLEAYIADNGERPKPPKRGGL
jgi:hypothetical protein